ncbi:MAG TPA: hypothetical protein HA302_08860 [Thermococcaceae archaeon]|nr:hypothetical protein [Thermococcus sibiricus]HII68089.1 hypothetical protein [Thermococcaceae archaeon]
MFNLSKRSKVQKLIFLIGVFQTLIGLSYLTHAYYVKLTWEYDEFVYDWDDVGGNDGMFWTLWGTLILLYSSLPDSDIKNNKLPIVFVLLPTIAWGTLSLLALGDTVLAGKFEPNIFTIFALLHAALLPPGLLLLLSLWKSS